MTEPVHFFVPGASVSQPRARIYPVGLTKDTKSKLRCPACATPLRAMLRALSTPRSSRVGAFRSAVAVRAAAAARRSGPLSGPLKLTLSFALPRPKARVWKRKVMPSTWHTKRPDLDNLLKGVLDACNGILWKDDTQLAVLIATKYEAAGDEQPGVHVRLERLGER